MKRIDKRRNLVILLAAAAVLCATVPVPAGDETEESVTEALLPQVSVSEYPSVDGSLACIPLMEALAKRVTGCGDAQAEVLADKWFTNTNPCYIEMAEGRRDLLLAYEPADETKERLAEYDPLIMEAVGKDALVFIVNKDNPVESLTQDQIRDIYTGKITNWSQVGGRDEAIRAFSRPETSGSQTLMRKLLLGDAGMIDKLVEEVPSMEGIINAILEYDNSANAIGYSVYYYASSMYDQPDLKFLQVDNVEPSNESIRKGEYSLVNPFYCVTREGSSRTALEIKDWLLSEEGQGFVEECGYVPAF